MVDTGAAGQSEKVLAAIKGLAPGKEIRWIINTTPTADHTGNNEQVSKAGRTVNGNQAAVVAHENANAADDRARRCPTPRGRTTPTSRRRATSRSTARR